MDKSINASIVLLTCQVKHFVQDTNGCGIHGKRHGLARATKALCKRANGKKAANKVEKSKREAKIGRRVHAVQ